MERKSNFIYQEVSHIIEADFISLTNYFATRFPHLCVDRIRLGWQDKSLITLPERNQLPRHTLRVVFLDTMARVWKHKHLELALHLCNRHILVQSIRPCKDQQLARLARQELFCQPRKPFFPVFLRGCQVSPPSITWVLKC